ncbi:MAG: hypothetical protein H6605_07020 [Flavobacteriales bacterium]|nr:hypothetical protein [Flavobacteriales bacterium]
MYSKETQNEDSTVVRKRPGNNNGRILAGSILVITGIAFLARQAGMDMPYWLFTWPVFLIVLGLFIGAKHNFQRGGWWIMILVGLVFLMDRLIPGLHVGRMIWPVVIIIIGLVFIFKPNRSHNHQNWKKKWKQKWDDAESAELGEDYIDSTTIFGSVKKNVITKNFKGGDIVCIFGGAEINLMQSEIQGRVELEIVQIFGGTKLIIPSHWEVVPEMVAILGGIEDKRAISKDLVTDEKKVLVIKGTSIFGGMDIRSY